MTDEKLQAVEAQTIGRINEVLSEGYTTADFVQVVNLHIQPNGEINKYWRNALYVGKTPSGGYVIVYSDGSKDSVTHADIRPAKLPR